MNDPCIPTCRSYPLRRVSRVKFLFWTVFGWLATAAWATAASTVQVNRDEKGVWFITGPDDAPLYDVFSAMGHAVATDRLFQMELFRRSGTGRMAEVFGEEYIETDTFVRTLGYSGECCLRDEHAVFFIESLIASCISSRCLYRCGVDHRLRELGDRRERYHKRLRRWHQRAPPRSPERSGFSLAV